MDDLALHLAGLDPEAGAAVRVVAHVDALVESRAGLQSIVRGAAGLAGCPVRLVDPARGLVVRVLASGEVGATGDRAVDPAWPRAEVTATGVELLVDATARASDRLAAARRLGVRSAARAIALRGGRWIVTPAGGGPPEGSRVGVGPAEEVLDLPSSAEQARLALRLTAEGTAEDPGPRVVHADQLGALALLVRAADGEVVPDVQALDRVATTRPGVLMTLDAVATTTSLRDAARLLGVHHSTLQDRSALLEAALGWEVRGPAGRLRLQLALVLRRADRPQL